jgi:RNA recognition motif-containing protein
VAKKLYVGNLPFSATEEDVRTAFSQFGEVASVSLINDRMTNRPRGFGFVEMENAEAAIEQLHGKDFGGRPLVVNEAREREQRPAGGRSWSNDRGGSGRNDRDGARSY